MSAPTHPAWQRALGNAVIAWHLGWARLMVRLGIRRRVDGWRRTTGLMLTSESSKFTLTSFGLDLWSDAPAAQPTFESAATHLMARLRQFLEQQPEAHWALNFRRYTVYPASRPREDHADIALARFADDGRLIDIVPMIDEAPDAATTALAARAIVDAFNGTRFESDLARPRRLSKLLPRLLDERAPDAAMSSAALDAARRILSGPFISIETMSDDADARFAAPDLARQRHPGWGLLKIVGRLSPDFRRVDLWVQVHHNAADGSPIQEMLTRLERRWGVAQDVVYPTPERFVPTMQIAATPGGPRAVSMCNCFLDLSNVLTLRRQLNRSAMSADAPDVTVAALLLWAMGHQPEFFRMRLACTVDVPADDLHARSVSFAGLRPSDYFGKEPAAGLSRYLAEFNRLVGAGRRRKSPAYVATSHMALLPRRLQRFALLINSARARRTFGTLGVSIIKDAKVFLSPMTDFGFEDGFIAIGSMSLPSADGRQVASISIKGDAAKIGAYPAALARAVEKCAQYVS